VKARAWAAVWFIIAEDDVDSLIEAEEVMDSLMDAVAVTVVVSVIEDLVPYSK
jgi:hypothetical protein